MNATIPPITNKASKSHGHQSVSVSDEAAAAPDAEPAGDLVDVDVVEVCVAVDVAVDVDVEVFVAVDVEVDVDVDVDVTVDVEVEVCVPVGAAADVVPVAIDDRDGVGRSIDREGLGRFEPPAQDAATSMIAQAARETLALPWRRNTPVIPYLQIPWATVFLSPRGQMEPVRAGSVCWGTLNDGLFLKARCPIMNGGRMSPSPLQGGQWVSTWPALLPIAMGSSDRRAHGTS